MANKTLKQRLDDIQDAIEYIQSGKVGEYRTGLSYVIRLPLSVLYKQEQELIKKIDAFGGDYIEGSNAKPNKNHNYISFTENI